MSGIQLIVGLANPGKTYAATRHNAGAWFVEQLLAQGNDQFRVETRFHSLFAQANIAGQKYFLSIPTTYMNHSGQAVQALSQYYKVPAESILVAHDELDLPVGQIKLKFDGGDGGHNGLKDIFNHLGTRKFYRLRIGIGRPKADVVDYVLKPPSKAERQVIDNCIDKALSIVPELIMGETQKAMQLLHT